MRARIIILLSVLGAIGVVAAALPPELRPMSVTGGWSPIALAQAPPLALAFLSCCAGLVLLLSTAIVIIDLRRIRIRLRRLDTPTREGLLAAFAAPGLQFLAYRVLDLAPPDASTASSDIVLQSRFDQHYARRQIFYYYRNLLIRSQFGTLLVMVVVILASGVLNEYFSINVAGVHVAAASALAAVGGLVMLSGLCWFVLGPAMEALLEALAVVPVSRIEMQLFRLLRAALDAAEGAGVKTPSAAADAALQQVARRLKRSQDVLHEAVVAMSASVEGLSAATKAALDHKGEGAETGAAVELRSAIASLTEAIEQMIEAPMTRVGLQPATEISPGRERAIGFGRELRRLMAELESLPVR